MKHNWLKSIFLFLVPVLLLPSCLGSDNEVVEPSDKAYFVGLTFAKNDSAPNIEKAKFSVVYDPSYINGLDSVIVNLDSLPYRSRIDSVSPIFRFASVSQAYLIYKNIAGEDSLRLLTGKDTLDFSLPLRVQNTSSDETTTLKYGIKVNVHQVQPELYVWQEVKSKINENSASNQHAFLFDGIIYYYLSTGVNNYLYTAPINDYANWTNHSLSLTGLPVASVELRHLQVFNDKFYLFSDENKIYSSSDGKAWNGVVFPDANYMTTELLFVFMDKLWAIVRNVNTQKYHIARTSNAADWEIGDEIPQNFPIEQYATLSFKTRLNVPTAIVVGGKTQTSANSYVWGTSDGLNWIDFSTGKDYPSITGASIIPYDGKLLMFQGAGDMHLTQSVNEGFSWSMPDTTYNKLPETYVRRSFQSVFVNETDKRIFIIGGKDDIRVLSDVWTGKLNRLNWEK